MVDNFESSSGFSHRMGFVRVDHDTQKRTLKESAYWYHDLILSQSKCLERHMKTIHVWDALEYPSARQIQHVKSFLEIIGDRYVDLIPNADLVTPNKTGEPLGYRGWAYCAHAPDFSDLLLCPPSIPPVQTTTGGGR